MELLLRVKHRESPMTKSIRETLSITAMLICSTAHAADRPRVIGMALPPCAAGYVEQGSDGRAFAFQAHVPIACRVPGGVVITGPGQSPGCGGGAAQYPCPDPIYLPGEDQ